MTYSRNRNHRAKAKRPPGTLDVSRMSRRVKHASWRWFWLDETPRRRKAALEAAALAAAQAESADLERSLAP